MENNLTTLQNLCQSALRFHHFDSARLRCFHRVFSTDRLCQSASSPSRQQARTVQSPSATGASNVRGQTATASSASPINPTPLPPPPVVAAAINPPPVVPQLAPSTPTVQQSEGPQTAVEPNKMDALASKVKNITLNAKKEVNVLLLGQSGIGKSTFINSVFNYMQYGDFDHAEKANNLTVLIPSLFTIFDKNGEQKKVKIGKNEDQNETLILSKSATKLVKSYTFMIKDTRTQVRLIDTPGMADTDGGVDKDNVHCENILAAIGELKQLHAICFLFDPKTTRATAFFSYCVTQLLSRLEKSASRNLVFVFTNTRGANYSPGQTFHVLQDLIKQISENPPYVNIPLNNNVFCFDNECFQYFAAVKEGIEFTEDVRLRNKESWKQSSEQCFKLFRYVGNLTPHNVKHTSAINEARRMIFQLSQPMAEIAQLINDNLYVLDRHKSELSRDHLTLQELKNTLYIPVVGLDVTKMTQPATVCTDLACSEKYKIADREKWHYKQRCHDPCYLQNVPQEIIGSPELMNCSSMNGTHMCHKCGHKFNVHMHIYYMTKAVESKQVDQNVMRNINSMELGQEKKKKLINDIERKKGDLDRELDVVVRSSAKFAHFLQHNAITPFSDAYVDYINYLILRERSLGQAANTRIIQDLEKLLARYRLLKRTFDNALDQSKKLGSDLGTITPDMIQDTIKDLYKLHNTGKKIKEMVESHGQCRSQEYKQMEYVHGTAFGKAAPAQKEQKKGGGKNADGKQQQQQHQRQQHQGFQNKNRGWSANRGQNYNSNNQKRGGRGNNSNNNNNNQRQGRRSSPPPPYDNINRPAPANPPPPMNQPPPPFPHAPYGPPPPPNAPGYGYDYGRNPQDPHPPPRNDNVKIDSGKIQVNVVLSEPKTEEVPRQSPRYDDQRYPRPGDPNYPYYPPPHYPPHYPRYQPPPPGGYPPYAYGAYPPYPYPPYPPYPGYHGAADPPQTPPPTQAPAEEGNQQGHYNQDYHNRGGRGGYNNRFNKNNNNNISQNDNRGNNPYRGRGGVQRKQNRRKNPRNDGTNYDSDGGSSVASSKQ